MTINSPSTPGRRFFHGPKCWIVSALIGALIGLALAWCVPAAPTVAGDPAPASRTLVVQVNPDGSKVRRLSDRSTAPLSATPVPAANLLAPAPHQQPAIPHWLVIPFAALLLSIAVMPFVSRTFWHRHYPDFAFLLGSLVLAYYLAVFGAPGRQDLLHVAIEYYSFIALVGGLYIASGGILVNIGGRGTPINNTILLGAGCILANILGTTGASILLIRPFMRMNQGRLRPIHIVFFIFIISNCGGALTPIGDPPLYLGYLKGVPFFWTLENLWPMWLLVNGSLLVAFFIIDLRIRARRPAAGSFPPSPRQPIIVGWRSVFLLVLLVAGCFIGPLTKQWSGGRFDGIPLTATFQIAVALCAYLTSSPAIRRANQFTFEPVREVGFLFIGIFLTMTPALGYLSANAGSFGLETPTQFYFLTGGLSATLDNAPTYLSFLQTMLGALHLPMTPHGIAQFIASTYELTHPATSGRAAETLTFRGQILLESISLGSVFFGALTYIGNGPNFMVKSIVETAHAQSLAAPDQMPLGTRMPSFFAYTFYALLILLPILVVNWFLFIR